MKGPMTDRARKVLKLASAEAIKLKHPYVGTEHLLLGLLREGAGVAAKALEAMGLDLKSIRLKVEQTVAPGKEVPPSPPLPLTPKANHALMTASALAEAMGHGYVGTEHILLGLALESEAVAAQVLVEMGADGGKIRAHVLRLMGEPVEEGEPEDPDLPDLPPLDAIDDGRSAAIADYERLCLDGLSEIRELKSLAQAAGEIMRKKDDAVSREDFEKAAAMRDAIAVLTKVVAKAHGDWLKTAGDRQFDIG